MASLPEVELPPQSPDADEEEPYYEKKPKVDTKRIFKNKHGKTDNEDKLAVLRTTPPKSRPR